MPNIITYSEPSVCIFTLQEIWGQYEYYTFRLTNVVTKNVYYQTKTPTDNTSTNKNRYDRFLIYPYEQVEINNQVILEYWEEGQYDYAVQGSNQSGVWDENNPFNRIVETGIILVEKTDINEFNTYDSINTYKVYE
jgi:hypothetical protein